MKKTKINLIEAYDEVCEAIIEAECETLSYIFEKEFGVSFDAMVKILGQYYLMEIAFEKLLPKKGFQSFIHRQMDDFFGRLEFTHSDEASKQIRAFDSYVDDFVGLPLKQRMETVIHLHGAMYVYTQPVQQRRDGVVYTPPEIVSFMNKSVEALLQKHFGESISSEVVQIIEPFDGTGMFSGSLLLDEELVPAKDFERFYAKSLVTNELQILAFLNGKRLKELIYEVRTGKKKEFSGASQGDTFLKEGFLDL